MSDSKFGLAVLRAFLAKHLPEVEPVELSQSGGSVKLRHAAGYEGWVPVASVLQTPISLRNLHLRGQQ